MPREGVFAEVLQEGTIHPGDTVITCYPDENRPFQAAVITLSDKGAKGERVDESGPAAKKLLEQAGYEVVETMILPDDVDKEKISAQVENGVLNINLPKFTEQEKEKS